MDKPISVGDLVMVVKSQPCCGDARTVGLIFMVTGMRINPNHYCSYCKEKYEALVVDGKQDGRITNVSRLKRIPPLQELDSIKTNEEITA